MEQWQRIGINAVVGFALTAGLYLLLGKPIPLALASGVIAGIGFGIAIWLLDRFEQRREA